MEPGFCFHQFHRVEREKDHIVSLNRSSYIRDESDRPTKRSLEFRRLKDRAEGKTFEGEKLFFFRKGREDEILNGSGGRKRS